MFILVRVLAVLALIVVVIVCLFTLAVNAKFETKVNEQERKSFCQEMWKKGESNRYMQCSCYWNGSPHCIES